MAKNSATTAQPSDPLWQESFARLLPGDLDQVYQLFEFRTCVETETAKLAAQRANLRQVAALQEAVQCGAAAAASGDVERFSRADEAFHAGVCAAAGNMFLSPSIDSIQRLQRQTTIIGLAGLPAGSLVVAAEQHRNITKAIAAGDSERAAQHMSEHIQMTLRQLEGSTRARLFATGT